MASIQKFTDSQMCEMLRHNNREILESSNVDIKSPEEMEKLGKKNYSFPLNHGGVSDFKYYKKLINVMYLYGRGTKRENKAIMAFGLVCTAPKEIVDNDEKVRDFFEGVLNFTKGRYGEENIINNSVHQDEAGRPHIHIVICCSTTIDHDRVRYRTIKTKKAVRLESGRYEYKHIFKLDENGERIPVKNYDRMTDYYDKKISGNDVLNKAELKNLGHDMQEYLDKHGIEGKVITGKTGDHNFTVKELKEFTKITGLKLEDVKEIMGDKSLLVSFVEKHSEIRDLEELLSKKNAVIQALREELIEKSKLNDLSKLKDEVHHKDNKIKALTNVVYEKEIDLAKALEKNQELQKRLEETQHELSEKQRDLEQVEKKLMEIENEKQRQESDREKWHQHGWDKNHEGWGERNQKTGWENVKEAKTW